MVEDVFIRLDADSSGQINFEEFQMGMLSQPLVERIFMATLCGKVDDQIYLYHHYGIEMPDEFRAEHCDRITAMHLHAPSNEARGEVAEEGEGPGEESGLNHKIREEEARHLEDELVKKDFSK